ncbi:MAG: HEPN domain-containing protein [Synergistaceae bacterium]|jgi:uncharacterized protein (UPF0332 family)|nr:HEPN domain-containing protein [Synergistaceae bacterium]
MLSIEDAVLPKMPGAAEDALREFVRRLVKSEGDSLARVVLFGSAARGEQDEWSDTDVFVLLRSGPIPDETVARIFATAWSVSADEYGIAPFIEAPGGRGPVHRAIAEEGVVLYDAVGNGEKEAVVPMTEEERKAIVTGRLDKAAEELSAGYYNLEKHPSASVSHAYHALFHATHALFAAHGMSKKIKTHKGLKSVFYDEFVHTGMFPRELAHALGKLERMRYDGDYNMVSVPRGDAASALDEARAFVARAEAMIAPLI